MKEMGSAPFQFWKTGNTKSSQLPIAASAVDPLQLLQHPLETLDAACLLHGSQAGAAARLLQQEGRGMREVWLGHCSVSGRILNNPI